MTWCISPRLLLAFTFLAVLGPAMGRLAVMSIDLGGEFIKIAIVKPGVPMEIVLNKESSRKTRTIVAFRDGERHFANDAYNTAVRFPAKAFWFLTHIIGRNYDDPLVEQFRERFPFYGELMVKDEDRGTVLFKVGEDTQYSVEELLGMVLEKSKEYAQDFAEQNIKDAVITVPPYYNQAERRAVLAAAELVGINVLQLMSDNAAVALNYGVFRRKNFNTSSQFYMFYDMGATSTVATIVGYQVVKVKEGTRLESNPQLTVKGVGYDRTLGGLEMTLRLRDHLANVFNNKKKRSIKVQDNPRAMAKLLKEAERVKKVLSANNDHMAQVEGLLEGEDFAAKVTREEYLNLIKDLLDRVTKPVEDALKASEITWPEINEVILMGGGSRLPKVQELLLKYSGKSDLGKSINTDEAGALGAVYQAAYLGKGFKVKTFHVRDANIFPINVEFEKQKSAEDDTAPARTIKRTLFGRMNPFPQRKVMTFNKHFKDFSFDVRYGDLDYLSEQERKAFPSLSLSNVSLVGVETAFSKHSEEGEYKGVKAHFRMDESGILHLEKVESVFEKQQAAEAEAKEDESTWSKIGSAFGGLFGGKEEGEGEGEVKPDTAPDGESGPQHVDTNHTDTGSNQTEQPQAGSNQSELDHSTSQQPQGETVKPDDETKDAAATDEKTGDDSAEKKEESTEDKQTEEPAGKEEKEEKTEKKEEESEEKEKKDKKEDKDKKDTKTEKEKKDEDKKDDDKKEKKDEESKKPATPKTVTMKEDLKADIDIKDLPGLSAERVKEAKKRLSALQKKDQEKVALEKAKNELESYIFDTQDKLTQEVYEACSTEEERSSIMQQLSEASDWLYEQPDDAKKDVYIDKLKELKDLMKDIALRAYEKEERPKALAALKQHLNATNNFLETVHNMSDPDDPMFTPVELQTLEKLINETTAWRDEAVAEQKKVPDHENPKLLVETIGSKIYALEREMKYLINKAKNFKPKPKVNKTNTTADTANATDAEDKTTKKGGDEADKTETKDDGAETAEEGEGDSTTTTTTTPPESQEASPDTEGAEDTQTEETEDNTQAEDILEKFDPESQSQTDKSSKKKRPKKKQEEEVESDETLEIGSDDLPQEDSQADTPHEEL